MKGKSLEMRECRAREQKTRKASEQNGFILAIDSLCC
jgi:hypothetical protein